MNTLRPVIERLHGGGRVRTWSLVITVFGDSVAPHGGRITSGQLQTILGQLDIDAGAVRTALSRLVRDGWLERDGAGRTGAYRLSAQGVSEFAEPVARVYAAPDNGAGEPWAMGVAAAPPVPQAIQVAPETWIWPSAAKLRQCPDVLLQSGALTLAEAAREALLTATHRDDLAMIAADIGDVTAPPADPLTALAARTALIHRWRRIVLRHPALPQAFLPASSPLDDPLTATAKAYWALSPGAERWLDGALGPMAARDAEVFERRLGGRKTKTATGAV
ncbi:MAG: PaaX family transcriptional regulator C-terminal domain-containing protein [Pseudomonadota bacterium]